MNTQLTYEHLAALEPRLVELLDEARAIKDDRSKPGFCANHVFFISSAEGKPGFKLRLTKLVGWSRKYQLYVDKGLFPDDDADEKAEGERFRIYTMSELGTRHEAREAIMAENPIEEPPEHAVLHTGQAYDLVYDTIYTTLPDCRNCNCP